MRIQGPPSAPYETVRRNATWLGASALFLDEIMPALWAAAVRYGVDPVGVVAQAFKETGKGEFPRLVVPKMYNPAGLKLRHPGLLPDTVGEVPGAHAQFVSWAHGADAHVQHLLCYAGTLDLTGRSYLVTDPRAWIVVAKGYRAETFAELSDKWAPSATYGQEIEDLAAQLAEEVA